MEPSQEDGDGSETKYGGESLTQNELCVYRVYTKEWWGFKS